MLFFIFFASKWNFKFIPLSLKIVTFIHLFFADFWVFHFLSFFCLFFFNFNFYFILLYNTLLVLPYIDMNPPWVYMSSQSWTPLPPPTPYHLSGSSPCTSPKHLVSCIEHRLAIRFLPDSICFNAILPNHPTLSLSHRVQKSALHICVSFAVSHTGSSLPSF